MTLRRSLALLVVSIAWQAFGCGDDDDREGEQCEPGTVVGCPEGQVCEEVAGGDPACFARVEIRGRVFDSGSGAGIEGATVSALDANGGSRSSVADTDSDGGYVLPVSVARDAGGTPGGAALVTRVTLRAAAPGYQVFPTAPRTALPIDLTGAEPPAGGEGSYVVQNAATDVALVALPPADAAPGVIRGRVDHEEPGGVLVVAGQGGEAVSTAVTDDDGEFALFNVPAGDTLVKGYRAGLNVTPESVAATDGVVEGVVLAASAAGLGTVEGSVNIVDAPGGAETTVILVVESTFVENAARGEAPSGLRADGITGAFAIAGVPPGKYVVLAAFENDDLVRDPDTGIAGTDIVHIEVPDSGGKVTLPESFKVTEALAVQSPGADELEVVSAAEPTFSWADDSSEDGYELRVYDAFGELVHEDTGVGRVTGSDTVSYGWSGADMEEGMVYQFRVLSYRDPGGNDTERSYISATEDLRGVFLFDPSP
jgi:hypothetical protein